MGDSGTDVSSSTLEEHLRILNDDFLQAIQESMQESPEACLAPVAMDYLELVMEAFIKKSPNLLAQGNSWDQYLASKDFTIVGRFFQGLKSGQFGPPQSSAKASSASNHIDNIGSNSYKATSAPSVSTNMFTSASAGPPEIKVPFNFAAPAGTSSTSSSRDKTVGLGTSSATPAFSFAASNTSSSTPSEKTASVTAPTATFTFGNTASSSASMSSTPSTFTFGKTSPTTTAPSTASNFTFGNNSSTPGTFTFGVPTAKSPPSTTSSGFSFSMTQPATTFANSGSSPGFSFSGFGNPPSATVNGTSAAQEDKDGSDDEAPPKPDHKPVEEEDALFTQRLKLFELENGKFKDLGIGNLFIKKLPSGKHQLVIRADNSLGTILLNTVLNESMPMKIQKPGNILVTVPVADEKPKIYVFRVKTPEMGEDTLKQLEKFKNDS